MEENSEYKVQVGYVINNIFLVLTLLLTACLILFFFYNPIEKQDELAGLIANMIQFTGVFSAILITYTISKIFQIRQEKIALIPKLEELSNKVTNVRRIANILIETYDFWESPMKHHFDRKYNRLDKCVMDEVRNNIGHTYKYLLNEYSKEFGQTGDLNPELSAKFSGHYFYLDLKALTKGRKGDADFWYGEDELNYIYESAIVEKWIYSHCGDFWYFLSPEGEWKQYSDVFHIEKISKPNKEKILRLIKKTEPSINLEQSLNIVLGELGGKFTSLYLYKLLQYLSITEKGFPRIIKNLTTILSITIISGLFIPIILSATNIESFELRRAIVYISLASLIASILFFLLTLKSMLKSVIDITDVIILIDE